MNRRLHWNAEGFENGAKPKAGILFLPGRGGHGYQMIQRYQDTFVWPDVALMAITPMPIEFGWYPMPNGPADQKQSVLGLTHAVNALEGILTQIEDIHGLPREKIVLAGFSAGAVVAMAHHTSNNSPCAGVVSHGGAILEPKKIKRAGHKRPIVLNHAEDDSCFEWFERYLPMKEGLINKGYKVWLAERKSGNHILLWQDIERCQKFYEKTLGVELAYTEWNEIEEDVEVSQTPDVQDPSLYSL